MVIGNLKDADSYKGLGASISRALDFLKKTDFSRTKASKIEIDGQNIYAMVQLYESRLPQNGVWETHKKYIDIHYIVDGSELIGYNDILNMEKTTEYDDNGDYILYKGKGDFFKLNSGYFAIFMPQDVHMPCIAQESPEQIKKVVIKVLM